MPNESFRYTKQISDQGRERSVEVRRERATLKRRLKAGEISPADVLNDEGTSLPKSGCSRSLKVAPVWGRRGQGRSFAHWACPRRRQFAPWVPCRRPAY